MDNNMKINKMTQSYLNDSIELPFTHNKQLNLVRITSTYLPVLQKTKIFMSSTFEWQENNTWKKI